MNSLNAIEQQFLDAAIEEAIKGRDEGGIPIGSVIVIDNQIVGRGHNRRVQQGSAILHAEMDAFENAGRLTASQYARATLTRHSRLVTCAAVPVCYTRYRESLWARTLPSKARNRTCVSVG